MVIDRELANQAIDKLLGSENERHRRMGGLIFRTLSREPAIKARGILVRKEINQIESKIGGVLTDDLRSRLLSTKESFRICEDNFRQLAIEANDIAYQVLQLDI